MFEKSTIGIFIVESPVHCGVGQDIGIVDQPIQRERYTNYPRIQGSEIKGVFRQYYKGKDIEDIFGPEESGDEGGDFASAISFGDARVLFMPIKSLRGTYVWITSKDVLEKFSRTLRIANINISVPSIFPINNDEIIIYDDSIAVDEKVILEEYMFTKKNGNKGEFNLIIDKIVPNSAKEYNYLKESLKKKLCIVSDDIFREFSEMSTEIITRIKIDKVTGTVKSGALWTEEYLPVDTILYFPVFAVKSRKSNNLTAEMILNNLKGINEYIQIGGNETVGKGFVRINWID